MGNLIEKDTRFQKGQSGNPSGRPKGSRNKASLIAKQLIEDDVEEIIKKLIELAKSGDMQAIKVIIERLLPPVKELPITSEFELPKIKEVNDIIPAYQVLLALVESGELCVGEAKEISGILEGKRKAIESTELKERIEDLKTIITSGRS